MRRALVALAVLLTACGVRPDAAPSRLDPTVVPSEAGVARPVVAAVYFVRGGRLVPARRLVVAPGTPAQRLAALVAGTGRDPGVTSYLAAAEPPLVEVRNGVAVVTVPASFGRLPRGERVLATAQIVLTLTGTPDVAVVRFVSAGQPFPAPLPEGGSTREPVTRAAYASLLS